MAGDHLGTSLVKMFERAASARGDRPFLWIKREGAYQPWSWRRVADEAGLLARSLAGLGVEPGDRVALVGESRPEWCIADLAILMAGGITVPAYTTNTAEEHAYILGHSEAVGVICSGAAMARRVLPAISGSRARFLITMEAMDLGDTGVPVIPWGEALARGQGAPELGPERRRGGDDVACFIYTSGTAGRPKGVMLSHGNVIANLSGIRVILDRLGLGEEVFLSFLPLSHAYEHTAGQFLPISIGAEIYYAESVDKLSANFTEVRPTIVTCVPRLFEVLQQRITTGVAREGGVRQRLFEAAVGLGRRRYEGGGSLPLHLRPLDLVLDRLVRAKARARFGGRLKAFVSGGAPLNYDVGLFFTALGLPLLQGYGQTESSPVVSVNLPWRPRIDTAGPPLEGVEVRIAEDGEILVRGGLVMQGYWKDPEATAAALQQGWLHTGDIGELDPDGYIKITDRKKDLIVNSGGDNVSPQRVEGILALEPEIGQVLVYGDRRPHLVALIVPHADALRPLAREQGGARDPAALAADPGLKALIDAAVARANKKLSGIERVRRFQVMPEPFTIESGLMTPTLKLKRQLIIKTHKELIESLYAK